MTFSSVYDSAPTAFSNGMAPAEGRGIVRRGRGGLRTAPWRSRPLGPELGPQSSSSAK